MPLTTKKDASFEPETHPVLGNRLFTITQSKRDAMVLGLIGVVIALVAVLLFFLSKRNDTLIIYGVLGLFIAGLCFVFALLFFLRGRYVTHGYAQGVTQEVGAQLSAIQYAAVNACKVHYYSIKLNTQMTIRLSDGTTNINLAETVFRWDLKSRGEFEQLIELVVAKIPRSVIVEGAHCLVENTKNAS